MSSGPLDTQEHAKVRIVFPINDDNDHKSTVENIMSGTLECIVVDYSNNSNVDFLSDTLVVERLVQRTKTTQSRDSCLATICQSSDDSTVKQQRALDLSTVCALLSSCHVDIVLTLEKKCCRERQFRLSPSSSSTATIFEYTNGDKAVRHNTNDRQVETSNQVKPKNDGKQRVAISEERVIDKKQSRTRLPHSATSRSYSVSSNQTKKHEATDAVPTRVHQVKAKQQEASNATPGNHDEPSAKRNVPPTTGSNNPIETPTTAPTISIVELKQQLESCIKTSNPTPHDFVSKVSSSVHLDKPTMGLLASDVLTSHAKLKDTIAQTLSQRNGSDTNDINKQEMLRSIQVQVIMRFQLMLMMQQHGDWSLIKYLLKSSTKKKRKRKRAHSNDTTQLLAQDLIEILEMVPFLLTPQDVTFAQFLVECCIPKVVFKKTIDTMAFQVVEQVLDYFEIDNVLVKSSNVVVKKEPVAPKPKQDTATTISPGVQVPPNKTPVAPKNVFAGLVESCNKENSKAFQTLPIETKTKQQRQKQPKTKKDTTTKVLLETMALTTKTASHKNSLIKDGGKERYVASHFSSNMSSLFRQVKNVSQGAAGQGSKQQSKSSRKSTIVKATPLHKKTRCSMVVSETPMVSKPSRRVGMSLGGGQQALSMQRCKVSKRKICLDSPARVEPRQRQSAHFVVQAALAARKKR